MVPNFPYEKKKYIYIYILKRKTKLTPKENQSTFFNQFTLAVIYSAVFNIYHSIFFLS